jgi:hypothetical protein
MLGLAGVLLFTSALFLYYQRPPVSAPGPATAVLTVIPAPSATLPGITPTSPFDVTPTPQASTTPVLGTIVPGVYIQIAGTGGDGLRLRTGPGLDNEVRFLGLEAEVFQVQDGPRQEDGYTWWYLVAPVDDSRNGWAVAEYLAVIERP